MLSLKLLGLDAKQAKNGRIMFNNIMGKGFVGLRSKKKRFGVSRTPCFTAYHFGLKSFYFERKRPKRSLGNTFGQ